MLRRLAVVVGALSLLPFLVGRTVAEESAGVVAEVEGTVEVGRRGTWVPAAVGMAIEVDDSVRTGRPGRLRIVFHDESVAVLGDDSQLDIRECQFAPDGILTTLMRLARGGLRVLVSEYYGAAGAAYEIETATAVAGVRGTEFIVSVGPGLTEIIGIDGVVAVHGLRDRRRPPVVVTTQEITVVWSGRPPTAPRRLSQDRFQQYLRNLKFVTGGRAEGLGGQGPVLDGSSVPEPERAESALVTAESQRKRGKRPFGPDASTLIGQPPDAVRIGPGRLRVEF